MATSYNNMATVYNSQGRHEEALVQHEKALEIRTRVFGSEHLFVAASYNNIAVVYRQQGRYEEECRPRRHTDSELGGRSPNGYRAWP